VCNHGRCRHIDAARCAPLQKDPFQFAFAFLFYLFRFSVSLFLFSFAFSLCVVCVLCVLCGFCVLCRGLRGSWVEPTMLKSICVVYDLGSFQLGISRLMHTHFPYLSFCNNSAL
jgi:hypothetical protein